MQKNILGGPLQPCSRPGGPVTGYNRDGMCHSVGADRGSHLVCAEMNAAFLKYNKQQGNDLTTPSGGFPGLRPGDRWCVCEGRYSHAVHAGAAPAKVHLNATHERAASVLKRL